MSYFQRNREAGEEVEVTTASTLDMLTSTAPATQRKKDPVAPTWSAEEGRALSGNQAHHPVMSIRSRDRAVPLNEGEGTEDANKDFGSAREVALRLAENNLLSKTVSRTTNFVRKDGSLIEKQFRDNLKSPVGLWCMVCHHRVAASTQQTQKHLDSQKHIQAMKTGKSHVLSAMSMTKFLVGLRAANPLLPGHTIAPRTDVMRLKCVRSYMQACTPLEKIDDQRDWIEEGMDFELAPASHLREVYVPLSMYMERRRIRGFLGTHDKASELARLMAQGDVSIKQPVEQCVSLSFDTSTRVDTYAAMVGRVVTADLRVHRILLSLQQFQRLSLAVHYREWLYNTAHNTFGLDFGQNADPATNTPRRRGQIVQFQRDRSTTNGAAYRELTELAPAVGSKDMKCLSHTFTHIAEHLELEDGTKCVLKRFKEDLLAMLNYGGASNKATTHWKAKFGVEYDAPGKTRCLSSFACATRALRR